MCHVATMYLYHFLTKWDVSPHASSQQYNKVHYVNQYEGGPVFSHCWGVDIWKSHQAFLSVTRGQCPRMLASGSHTPLLYQVMVIANGTDVRAETPLVNKTHTLPHYPSVRQPHWRAYVPYQCQPCQGMMPLLHLTWIMVSAHMQCGNSNNYVFNKQVPTQRRRAGSGTSSQLRYDT